MSLRRSATTLFATAIAASLIAAAPAATELAPPDPNRWAPVATATIYPSVYMTTNGAGCTSNFVHEEFVTLPNQSVRRDVYLGYAAHCAGKGGSTDTNGCLAGSQALGTQVTIKGASKPGVLAYSSWATMIAKGQATSSNECKYNDFALVLVDPADHAKVNPSVPVYGGPTALGGASARGDLLYSVGNSSLRLGIGQLGPKNEVSLGMESGGWSHRVYAVSPGIPGDSGSGHMDAQGRAMGVSSTLALLPYAGSNGVADLRKSLDYMYANTALRPQLVAGTQAFKPRP